MATATEHKVLWRAGDNTRVSGWDQIRARLDGEDGKRMLLIFSTCTEIIRTLPALQHNENKPEDAATDGEDHAPDSLRYGLMSRPYTRPKPHDPNRRIPIDTRQPTFDEMVHLSTKQNRAARRARI